MPALTPQLIVAQAARLGEGGHRYSARQLYYASCAAAEADHPSATKGIIGMAAVLILLGAALVRLSPPAAVSLGLIGVAGLLFALLNSRTEQAQALARAAAPRPLAMSYEGFTTGPLREALAGEPERLRLLIGAEPEGADAGASSGRPGESRRRPRGALLLACEREETARMLTANLPHLPAGSEVLVLPAENGTALPPGEASPPAAARGARRRAPAAIRRRTVLAVHDADPEGCALPSRLRRGGAARVIDLGLCPPSSDARLAVLEGAPARVSGDVEEDLTELAVGWLRSGRRLELATLSPAEVLARITGAAPTSTSASRPRRVKPPTPRSASPSPAQPESVAVSPAGSQTPAR